MFTKVQTSLIAFICTMIGIGAVLGAGQLVSVERAGPNAADIGFYRDMMTHHEQAISMSFDILEVGETGSIKQEAVDIILSQRGEYVFMDRQLLDWDEQAVDPDGNAMAWMGMKMKAESMPGLATPKELKHLRSLKGKAADIYFLRLMVRHHMSGAAMAREAAKRAKEWQVIGMATRMDYDQRTEVSEMVAAGRRLGVNINPSDPMSETNTSPTTSKSQSPTTSTTHHKMEP